MLIPPEQLYEVAEGAEDDGARPVLVHALHGFVDAGSGAQLAADHLVTALAGEVVATFDVDLLLDYRSRRPPMVFEARTFTAYEQPSLVLHRLRDTAGVPFLLLSGPEPDVMWRRFVDAVDLLIQRFGVRLTVGLTAIPWATPHTRPLGVIAHSPDPALVQGYEAFGSTVRVPAHIDALLEYTLGARGRPAIGFAGQVPHYLAQLEYPDAAGRLLDAVSGATGLTLPAAALLAAGQRVRDAVDAQIADSPETLAVVSALEAQYDAALQARVSGSADGEEAVSTGEDLAAQFERFLAQREHGGGPA